MKYFTLFLLSVLFSTGTCFSQKDDTVADLDLLISSENYSKIYSISKERLAVFFTTGNADTIPDYINYLGKATAKLKGDAVATTELLALLKKAKEVFPYHKALVSVYLEAASFFSNQGNHELAYQLTKDIDQYFLGKPEVISGELTAIQSNLGDYAMRLGKYAISSGHYLKSIEFLKRNPKPDAQKLYFANNALGIVMWYSSKVDSAVYFFSKAVDALNTMDSTPQNRFFRVALVQNNMASCYNVLGKTTEAISMFESVIANYKKFIASPQPNPKKDHARISQFQSVDNLAKVFLELGDFTKAHDLLYYSYRQKLANFGDKSPEIYKSLIFLGTIYNNQRNFNKAKTFLEDGIARVKATGDINNSWGAEGYSQLAIANDGLKNNVAAAANFKEANRIYELVYDGQYDDLYLSYLYQVSMFYATDNEPGLAVNSITKGLDYVRKAQGENSLQVALQLKNLAAVNFKLKKYIATASAAVRGLTIVNKLAATSKQPLDSIKIAMEKPGLILLQSKANYELLTVKDTQSINGILTNLYEAKNILEKRKTIFTDEKDINTLNADNKELLDFIKQLNLELYHLTGKATYLDKIIGLQEAGMYARIRSRMDKQRAIHFSNIPDTVINREIKLKDDIKMALQGTGRNDQQISTYLTAWTNWNAYQDLLKNKYPDYYNMRYAKKEQSLPELCKVIPAEVTAVRYFFVADSLYALVADKQQQQLFSISSQNLSANILVLHNSKATAEKTTATCFTLYQQLWQPIEKAIRTPGVIIIPDGILYNLSFEMLTSVPVNNYASLANNCLLNKYAISYHYSLLAINPQKRAEQMKDNFIGFTPGFTDQQKKEYSGIAKNDSLHLDNTYLSLLPLPFTASLAQKIQDKLGGELFLNNQSTPAAFKEQAGNHSIIYIGTHAESNNSFPEYSRLIFAKDLQHTTADNSLYLFDIYNCNLASNLAVLTACESGSPGYQDGEGMISMAHAFNYAGSESILTGLWKIDEQTSTIITDLFYKFLQEGLRKDEALQKAKLEYLKTHNGRLLGPQYWAGLVIMGDTSPVVFKSTPVKWWIIAIIVALSLLIVGSIYFWKKKRLGNV